MKKKNANNAIDFAKLFAVKDQLHRDEAATTAEESEPVDPSGAFLRAVPALASEPVESNELESPAEVSTSEASAAEVVDLLPKLPELESAPLAKPSTTPTKRQTKKVVDVLGPPSKPDASAGGEMFLRVGMSRALHERLRALSALRGQSPTSLVRELFDRVTPVFDVRLPMSKLAVEARAAVPMVPRERRIDARMQVPVSEELHRRMQQFAALRAQTLAAGMLDVLEAHAPLL